MGVRGGAVSPRKFFEFRTTESESECNLTNYFIIFLLLFLLRIFFENICYDYRSLSGDHELVLDYIIERKRMDDLAASIIDGRFREQKVTERLLIRHSRLPALWFCQNFF